MLSKKKKIIILVVMVALLVVTGYLNIALNNNVTTHTAINNFAFEHLLDSTFETLSFRVKSSSKDTNFSEDSNYSESLTYKNPLYINKEEIDDATFINLIKNNDSINIYNELNFDRISRYKFLYRNRMYNLRKKGIKGMIRYFLLLIRDILLVLFKGKYKIRKIIIIMKGCILGLFFYPRIEK